MTEKEFIEKLADILDCEEELKLDTDLTDVEEWDSLGVLTFLAEMNKYTSFQIKAGDVKKSKTVADLFALIK